jgi:hypothetical protein
MRLICFENKNRKAEGAALLLKKYGKVLGDEVIGVDFLDDADCVGDEYRIEKRDGKISVFGNTAVAFNAAVGYLIRHQETGIEENVTVTFASDFRAVYFANHFYNYYHAAPVDELCEYLESLKSNYPGKEADIFSMIEERLAKWKTK